MILLFGIIEGLFYLIDAVNKTRIK